MGNGFANTVLLNRIADDIKALEADVPNEVDPHCSTRAPIKRGVTTLLEIKKAEMEENASAKNSIKIGNITITGTVATIGAIVAYLVMKVHGVI